MEARARSKAGSGGGPWLSLYVGAVILAGVVALFEVMGQWGVVELGVWELALFIGLAGVLDVMVVPMAGAGGVGASFAFAVLFAGLLVLGAGPTAWMAALAMLWSEGLVRRRSLARVGFNAAHSVLSLLAAGWVYQVLGGRVGRVDLTLRMPQVLWVAASLVGAAATLWLLETGWVSLAAALERGGFARVWSRLRASLQPILALDGALASVGLLLALLYQNRGQLVAQSSWPVAERFFLAIMILIPCALLYYAYWLQGRLREVYAQSLSTLGALLEAKVEGSQPGHGERVGLLAAALAQELELPPGQIEQIRYAGYLHDIGKVGVPSALLNRSRDQFSGDPEPVRLHPEIGAAILTPIHFLQPAAEMVQAHHERWDGLGYPKQLRQQQIPLGARLLSLANAYVGMTHSSAHPLLTPQQAITRIHQATGSRFGPTLVAVLRTVLLKYGEIEEAAPGTVELARR